MQEDTSMSTNTHVKSLSYEASRPIPFPSSHVRRTKSELFMLEAEALDLCMRHRISSARGDKSLLGYNGANRRLPREDLIGKKISATHEPERTFLKSEYHIWNKTRNVNKKGKVQELYDCDAEGFGPMLDESASLEERWREDDAKEGEMFEFDF